MKLLPSSLPNYLEQLFGFKQIQIRYIFKLLFVGDTLPTEFNTISKKY